MTVGLIRLWIPKVYSDAGNLYRTLFQQKINVTALQSKSKSTLHVNNTPGPGVGPPPQNVELYNIHAT
jgi:hypothetical protein